ncbi:MAG TPA: T9SS type A sorting domain-containing protein [Patescibacteria group bacterium]|nr:T9SS type A sorting domain-containing protein [Patescibacteria group bacterium]
MRRVLRRAGIDRGSNNGSEVGSGVYFYEMKSGNFRKTRKMVVLR